MEGSGEALWTASNGILSYISYSFHTGCTRSYHRYLLKRRFCRLFGNQPPLSESHPTLGSLCAYDRMAIR